jgi:hypothetical protein
MKNFYLKLCSIGLITFLSNTAQAASLIPVCSENKSINNCSKSRLSFPAYQKDSEGKASFHYRIDQGALGELSSQETNQFAQEVLGLWSDESNIEFIDDGEFETDINKSNFRNYVDQEQGFNLIIWDEAGDIIESLAGAGSQSFVLGYATPIAYNYKNNKIDSIKEAQTLLNGFLFDRTNIGGSKTQLENLFKTTLLHEFAHMFGIDHTQGGNLEGYNNREGNFTDIPVMFPLAANPSVELHADDKSVIKLAYPKTLGLNSFGTIFGSLTKSGNPIEGANIVAYKLGETNPKLFAVASPSDVDGLGRGNYVLPNLTPGDYVLRAEPLDASFQGGSSIGFHETPANFESGFYNGSNSFLKIGYDEGLSQGQVINISAGSSTKINIDVDNNPSNNSGGDNGDASFIAGGRLINGSAIRLTNSKIKKSKIKLVNLNPGEAINIKISTDYPNLIQFAGAGSYNFKSRSKVIAVKLASYLDFIDNPDFEELVDFGQVAVPVTIEDLDTGYIKTETLIVE